MAERKPRALTVKISGVPRSGKTTLLWMLINQLETFGAEVIVDRKQERPELVKMMRERPHPIRPGHMHGLTVTIEQETLDEDEE